MIQLESWGQGLQSQVTSPGPVRKILALFSNLPIYSVLSKTLHNSSCQDCIASWLCEEMTRDGLELDQLDPIMEPKEVEPCEDLFALFEKDQDIIAILDLFSAPWFQNLLWRLREQRHFDRLGCYDLVSEE